MTRSILKTVSLWRGLYARVARKAKCDASYVSKVAHRVRRSETVEAILQREYLRTVAKTVRLKSHER